MDSGLIFVLGVAFGLLGGVGFILLLVGTDDYATVYFSAYWRRLGAPWAAKNPEAQETTVNSKENDSQSNSQQAVEEQPRPAIGSVGRGISLLLAAVLLSGCASVGGGAVAVHAPMRAGELKPPQAPASPRTEDLPVCGFEAPYLPDPCRLEVTPGEWLRISNPTPKETKHHGWLWWLLMSLIAL